MTAKAYLYSQVTDQPRVQGLLEAVWLVESRHVYSRMGSRVASSSIALKLAGNRRRGHVHLRRTLLIVMVFTLLVHRQSKALTLLPAVAEPNTYNLHKKKYK